MDVKLSKIVYVLSEWTVLSTTIKAVSTLAPDDLLVDSSLAGVQKFLSKLKAYRNRLINDYSNFVRPLCNDERYSETMVNVTVKYSYVGVFAAINRLIEAYETYATNYNKDRMQETYRFFASVLLPASEMYHHRGTGLEVTADLLHKLFAKCFFTHLNTLCHNNTEKYIDPLVPANADANEIVIYKNDKQIDAILRYSAVLGSFPVLGPNLTGQLASTVVRSDLGHLKLDMPSADNRSYVTNPVQPRACIACQLDFLATGETDKTQQLLKNKCKCLFKRNYDSYFEQAYIARAQAMVRLLIVQNKNNGGCDCATHKNLFKSNMKALKNLLDRAHVE